LTFIGLQFFELQFQLLDLPVELLGFAAELVTAQRQDLQLQGFDLQFARRERLRKFCDRVLALGECRIAGHEQRLEGGDVVREVGGV
jgi:hypothetical protein